MCCWKSRLSLHELLSLLLGVAAALTASCSRSAPQAPPKPPPPPLEYLGEWGARGDGPGQLSHPVSVAVDDIGNVYVTDAGSGYIHKFDADGHPLLSFQDDVARHPDGIAVDRGGAIYVTDAVRGRVVVFLPEGDRHVEFRCVRVGKSAEPLNVAVDEDGNIYVADPRLHRIQKFNPRGRLAKVWGHGGTGPDRLESPGGLAVGPDGFLYVSDADDRRVVKFSREGDFTAALSPPSSETALIPAGLAVSVKYVFVVDSDFPRLHVWMFDGQYRLSDDLGNHLSSEPSTPHALAVSPRGELLVLDPGSARVLRFRINF